MKFIKLWHFVTILLFLLLPFSALSQSQPEGEPYIVDLTAVDYAFAVEDEIPSGWVTFRMSNKGKEEHVAVIVEAADSLNLEQAKELTGAAIESGNFRPLLGQNQGTWGGPGLLSAGLTGETTVKLEPGTYIIYCGVKTPEGRFHYQEGMIRAIKVTEESTQAPMPEASATITLSDYGFSSDKPISAGEQVLNLSYTDSQNHDLHLTSLKEGQELSDVREWLWEVQAPSPFNFLGGAEQTVPGNQSSFKVDLKPGRYAFVCHTHAAWGEVAELIIPESGGSTLSSQAAQKGEVIIEAKDGELSLPEELETGQWNFVVQNGSDTPQIYLLHKMKQEKDLEDFIDFMENILLKGRIVPGQTSLPAKRLVLGIPPGQQKSVSLQVYDGDYVLMGPLTPGVPLPKVWSRDLLHEFTGTDQ